MAKKAKVLEKPTVKDANTVDSRCWLTSHGQPDHSGGFHEGWGGRRANRCKSEKGGYPAYLSRIVIPDKGLWFRVRVGSYKNREQAAADMARLARDQKNPILVKK
jgi:hypothetical protein